MPHPFSLGEVTAPDLWRLSRAETDVMDSLVEHGRVERVATLLNIVPATVRNHCYAIRRKAGVDCMVMAVVAWDRYSRKAAA